MEHAKKMMLVPPEFIQRLTASENTDPKILSRLDHDMHKVLSSKIEDYDKWAEYNQVLQRYLHFAAKKRRPINIPVQYTPQHENTDLKEEEIVKAEIKHERLPEDEILSMVPKKYMKKADNFIRLLDNSGEIAWDTKGLVSIKGEIIPHSNIVDLLNDALRARKTTTNPRGWEQFALAIQEINVPLELIGNPKHRNITRTIRRTTPALQLKSFSEYDYDADTEAAASKVTNTEDSFQQSLVPTDSVKKRRLIKDSDAISPKNTSWLRFKL